MVATSFTMPPQTQGLMTTYPPKKTESEKLDKNRRLLYNPFS